MDNISPSTKEEIHQEKLRIIVMNLSLKMELLNENLKSIVCISNDVVKNLCNSYENELKISKTFAK